MMLGPFMCAFQNSVNNHITQNTGTTRPRLKVTKKSYGIVWNCTVSLNVIHSLYWCQMYSTNSQVDKSTVIVFFFGHRKFPFQISFTHQMSEVCHHASTLALCHVQGLAFGPQDIKTSISASMTGLVKQIHGYV